MTGPRLFSVVGIPTDFFSPERPFLQFPALHFTTSRRLSAVAPFALRVCRKLQLFAGNSSFWVEQRRSTSLRADFQRCIKAPSRKRLQPQG
jgi:hypothetical protein